MDEFFSDATTYQADFDEWVQNGCEKAADRIRQTEEQRLSESINENIN